MSTWSAADIPSQKGKVAVRSLHHLHPEPHRHLTSARWAAWIIFL